MEGHLHQECEASPRCPRRCLLNRLWKHWYVQYVDHCGSKLPAVFKMVISATHVLGPTHVLGSHGFQPLLLRESIHPPWVSLTTFMKIQGPQLHVLDHLNTEGRTDLCKRYIPLYTPTPPLVHCLLRDVAAKYKCTCTEYLLCKYLRS